MMMHGRFRFGDEEKAGNGGNGEWRVYMQKPFIFNIYILVYEGTEG